MHRLPDRRVSGSLAWDGVGTQRATWPGSSEIRRAELLEMLKEPEFQELTALAAEICEAPISLITVLDDERQWVTSSVGTDFEGSARKHAFCSYAVSQPDIFMVEDASTDSRFQENPLVTGDPKIRFYAGVPLNLVESEPFGTLCVIDVCPRKLKPRLLHALEILGRQVATRLELRAKQRRLEAALSDNQRLADTLRETNDLFTTFMENAPSTSFIKDAEGRYLFYNREVAKRFGITMDAWIGKRDVELFEPEVANALRAHDLKVLRERRLTEFEESVPEGDGRVTHWLSYKFPVTNRKGETLLGGISFDRTKEHASREALNAEIAAKIELTRSLEASQARFRTFMQHNPNMVSLKANDGEYLYYNQRFAEFFGIGEGDWIGRKDIDVLPVEVALLARSHDEAAFEQGHLLELCSPCETHVDASTSFVR